MQEIQPVTVYNVIDIKERLPPNSGRYHVLINGVQDSAFYSGTRFEVSDHVRDLLTHWLEKQEDVYLFTKEEFDAFKLDIAGKAYQAGLVNGHEDRSDITNFSNHPDKETYLSNLSK